MSCTLYVFDIYIKKKKKEKKKERWSCLVTRVENPGTSNYRSDMDSSSPVSQRAKISGDLIERNDWIAAKLLRNPLILL